MLKKYHVIINKIETIEHEFEAENIKELKEYLKNYADNFEKFDENKSKKFVFQIANNNLKKKNIELNCTNSKK